MDRDPASIFDIVTAGRKLIGFVVGRSRADLDEDLMLQFAVLHAIAIVGEAANRLSPEFRKAHPAIPWGEIIGTRNRIIHGYSDVKLDIIWDIAANKIYPLLEELEPLLPKPPEATP
jgi:uncharacterized protein with HEPN domain